LAMITFECSHCSQRLITPAEYAGQEGACPRCTRPVRVPITSAAPTAPEPKNTSEAAEPVSYLSLDAAPAFVPLAASHRGGVAASVDAPATPLTKQVETVAPEEARTAPETSPMQVTRAAGYQILEELGRG